MLGFHEVQFPNDTSWGTRGGPVFKTQVYSAFSGAEKRNIDWSQPHMKFDVAYNVRTDDQVETLRDFYIARQGQLYGFRFRNLLDYRVRETPIAIGDGVSRRLPIWRMRTLGEDAWHYKRLYKIVPGSVRGLWVNAVPFIEGTINSNGYFIDYNAGEVGFVQAPAAGAIITATLEFDEPVRFADDSLQNSIEAFNNNDFSAVTLVGVRDDYTVEQVYNPTRSLGTVRDPYFESVILMMEYDRSNTSNFVDLSRLSMIPARSGTVVRDTTTFRNGGGSVKFGTTGAIQFFGEPFDLLNRAVTIETFATKPQTGETLQPIIGKWRTITGQASWVFRFNRDTDSLEFLISTDGLMQSVLFSYPWDSVPGFFDHICVERTTSDHWVLRINGVARRITRDTRTVFPTNTPLVIGNQVDPAVGTGAFQGNIDSLRVTRDVARYGLVEEVKVPGIFPPR